MSIVMRRGINVLPNFFDLEWAVPDDESIAHVMEEADLRVEVCRAPSGALSESYDSLVSEEFDEEPFSVADRRVDIVQEDGFVSRHCDRRRATVLRRGLAESRGGGHAGSETSGGHPRVMYETTPVDTHPSIPLLVPTDLGSSRSTHVISSSFRARCPVGYITERQIIPCESAETVHG